MVQFTRHFVHVSIKLLRIYQKWNAWYGCSCCRFRPTCSTYAIDALDRHGLCRGGLLILGRLLRCQPFSRGGEDPVPSHCSFPFFF